MIATKAVPRAMVQWAGTPGRFEGNAKEVAEGVKDAIVRLVLVDMGKRLIPSN